MADLIIDDELQPPPACPQCKTVLPQMFLQVFADTAECPRCQCRSRLSDLAGPTAQNLSCVPPRISISENGTDWTLIASNRSPWQAIYTWLFALVWGTFLAFRPTADRGLIWYWLIMFTPLLVAKAVLQSWGHYAIVAEGPMGSVFTGIGKVGWKRSFSRERLQTVRLRTERAGHRGGVKKTVVLDADHIVRFGEELSDQQRYWIAAFLAERGSSPGGDLAQQVHPSFSIR